MARLLLIILTISSLAYTSLCAQSAEEAVNLLEGTQGFGMRAAAMGNAYIGVADDYSAIFWNPAGLAQLRNGEIYTSLRNLKFSNDATYLGNKTTGERSFTKFESFGLVYPFPVSRGSLVLSLGYQKVKDLDTHLEYAGYLEQTNYLGFNIENELGSFGTNSFDNNVQQQQSISADGHLSQWSFGMAIDLSPRFSAGLTLNLLSGTSEHNLEYSQDDINAMNSHSLNDEGQPFGELFYNYYDFNQMVSSEYSGFEAKLGGLFRLSPNARLGATITFPKSISVDEEWSKDDELSYDIVTNELIWEFTEAYDLGSGVFDYKINVPFQFGFGASYQTNLFLISASGEYTDWSQLEYEMPDDRYPEDYTALLDENSIFREDYTGVLSYSVGAELTLLKKQLSLRGGYRYVPSPLKNADKKYDKTYFSGGIGYQVDRNTVIEGAYTIGQWEKNKFYNYDWDADPMETSEKYTTSKLSVGVRLFF